MGLPYWSIEVAGNCLLFLLVFGMSATVDIGMMMKQIRNKKAILSGIFLQFIVLPFLGFITVKMFKMDDAVGVTLLVVTSSPGGSYSNWWCSLFNADLALSITMTTISTALAVVMLPLNLVIYTKLAFHQEKEDVVGLIDFGSLFTSLIVVISAIASGIIVSDRVDSHNFNLHANRLGNLAGVALVIFSAVMANMDEESQIWERDAKFYFGVAMPCVLALIFSNIMTTYSGLKKPERVTSSIECCYQNVGIATSVALSMFKGNDLAEAMGVPFYYGIVEAVVLGLYCLGAWKAGWTKAPPHEPFWKVITCSYEVLVAETLEKNMIEVKSAYDAEEGAGERDDGEEGAPETPYYSPDSDAVTGSPSPKTKKKHLEERMREKRGPKEESYYHMTLATDFLRSLGYKV